jgi:hypothetical protein
MEQDANIGEAVVTPELKVRKTRKPMTPKEGPRYSVSRQGMGGRKEKYTSDQMNEVIGLVNAGKSLLSVSKEKGYPYVSIRATLKRHQLWPIVVSNVPPVV